MRRAVVDKGIKSGLTIALALALAMTGCLQRSASNASLAPSSRLAKAERAAAYPVVSSSTLARAGMLSWAIAGDLERASGYFDKALSRSSRDPMAWLGRLLLANESGQDEAALDALLTLIHEAPASPMTELALSLFSLEPGHSLRLEPRLLKLSEDLSTGSLGLAGPSALRAREILHDLAVARGDDVLAGRLLRAAGGIDTLSLVGPLHPYRVFDFHRESPFDSPQHPLQASYPGVGESLSPRVFTAPQGRFWLEGEGWDADVFEALSEVELKEAGEYLLSLKGVGMARLDVNGEPVIERSPLKERPGEQSLVALHLSKGRHRLRLRFSRAEGSNFSMNLARRDGAPADHHFEALAEGQVPELASLRRLEQTSLERRVAEKVGDEALATYLQSLALLVDAPEKARERLAQLELLLGENPALRLLRADLAALNSDLPTSLRTAMVAQELEEALKEQPRLVRALIFLFQQEMGAGRYDEARARLEVLDEMLGDSHPQARLLKSELLQAQGNDAAARRELDEGLKEQPESCSLGESRLRLAQMHGELKVEAELNNSLLTCPRGRTGLALHHRKMGNLQASREIWESLIALRPWGITLRFSAADIALAQGDFAGAERLIQPLLTLWPRSSLPLHRLARIRELAGDVESARRLRKELLRIQGNDLATHLAQAADLREEALSWALRDGKQVISEYLKSPQTQESSALEVLDLAALEVLPDGSVLERVHSIVQVLDKRGIDRFGEQKIPASAHVLLLRTIKPDLSTLDVEHISQKSSISMPNLEPGDFIELVYLRTRPAASRAEKAWSSERFNFRAVDLPIHESVLLLRVPEALGLELDVHNISEEVKVQRQDGYLITSHTAHNVAPYVREPHTPSLAEFFPWIEAGARLSEEEDIRAFADSVSLQARSSPELRAFVEGMRGLGDEEKLRSVLLLARSRVQSDTHSRDFSQSPAAILAMGRGNRSLLVKAALDELGVHTRYVLAWPYSANPHPQRFPRRHDTPVLLLQTTLSSGAVKWLQLGSKFMGPGLSLSLSKAQGWVVPAPGEEPRSIELPEVLASEHRVDYDFDLALAVDGSLSGQVVQSFHGRRAAGYRQQLERSSNEETRRRLEGALSGLLPGAEVNELEVQDSGNFEDPVRVLAQIEVPDFARRPNNTLAIPATFRRAHLGSRYLTRSQRESPLLLPTDSVRKVTTRLKLPEQLSFKLPNDVEIETQYGSLKSQWKGDSSTLHHEETLLLHRKRIPVAEYSDFKTFIQAIDAAQSRELEGELQLSNSAETAHDPKR